MRSVDSRLSNLIIYSINILSTGDDVRRREFLTEIYCNTREIYRRVFKSFIANLQDEMNATVCDVPAITFLFFVSRLNGFSHWIIWKLNLVHKVHIACNSGGL